MSPILIWHVNINSISLWVSFYTHGKLSELPSTALWTNLLSNSQPVQRLKFFSLTEPLSTCQRPFYPIRTKTTLTWKHTWKSHPHKYYIAYLEVHSLAVLSCLALSVFRSWAMSGTSGSSGLGSVRREQILSNTLLMVRAGLHWSLRMSRQMPPFELMLQW